MSVDDWTLMHNDGVHTCNPQCKRPMRVLRREKEELEAEVYRLDCASLALQMELDSVASQKEELAGKVERLEKVLDEFQWIGATDGTGIYFGPVHRPELDP